MSPWRKTKTKEKKKKPGELKLEPLTERKRIGEFKQSKTETFLN